MKNMNKTNYFVLPVFIILSIIAMTMMASAVVTLATPTTGSNSSTNVVANCTTDQNEVYNVTWFYNTSGGPANTILSTLTNTSVNQPSFKKTISISALTDATTYNMTCGTTNSSNNMVNSTGVVAITFDSTKPTCTVTKTKFILETFNEQNTLTCTCTDAIDASTVNTRTLTKPTGSVTITADSYVTKASDTDQVGQYTYACYSTDSATNVATTASTTFTGETSEEVDSSVGQAKAYVKNNTMIMFAAALAVVLIIVTLIIFSLKKNL